MKIYFKFCLQYLGSSPNSDPSRLLRRLSSSDVLEVLRLFCWSSPLLRLTLLFFHSTRSPTLPFFRSLSSPPPPLFFRLLGSPALLFFRSLSSPSAVL